MYTAVKSAVSRPTTQSRVWPLAKVLNRISSLLKNPAKPGTPAMAIAPMRNVQ